MKTVLDIADDKAKNELSRLIYISYGAVIISFFVYWWLGFIGIALGARAFLLTFHKANAGRNDLLKLRIASGIAIVISIALIAAYLLQN